jgi:hypothetical protein
MLQTQCSRELDLWQTGHEIAEKSSKIVSLAAPLVLALYIQLLGTLPLAVFRTFRGETLILPALFESQGTAVVP